MKAKKINTYIFDLDDTLYEEIQFVKAGMMSVCLYVSKKYGLECKELFDYCMELLEKEGRGKIFDNLCAKYELDDRPIEEGCNCPTCRKYSRAYIRHLLKAKEMLGMRLCVLHNLYFYNTMMEEIRNALDKGEFLSYKRAKLAGMEENNEN